MGRNGDNIREASATSYEITFTYKGQRCRERIKLKPSPANRKRVANHLGAINVAIEQGTFDYKTTFPDSPRADQFYEYKAEVTNFEVYMDNWLHEKTSQLKSSTLKGYIKIYNNILLPWFKGRALSDIKRADVKSKIKTVVGSNKYLSNIQSCLRSALQDAVDDDILEINPIFGWSYKNKEAPKNDSDVDPFTPDEQAQILANMSGQIKNMFQFFFWTGLRTSELVALDWGDIDWLTGTIHIYKGMTQGVSEAETPKTASGKRKVKLLPPALQALEDQKQYTFLAHHAIFHNPFFNERWKGDAPIRKSAWIPAIKKAGVRYRRPYQTRHTYASMMLTADESIPWLAQQMGHKDWAMLRKIYAKYIKDAIPDAGSNAVKMFGEKAGIKAGNTTPNNPKKLA